MIAAALLATGLHARESAHSLPAKMWKTQSGVETPCFPIGTSARFCAGLSPWKPVLSGLSPTRVALKNPDGFDGEINIVSGIDRGTQITNEEIAAFLGNMIISRERRGFQIDQGVSRIGGLPARTVVFEVPFEGVTAFSILVLQNKALIAQTLQRRTTLYLADHKASHASLLDAIRLEGAPL